MLRIENARSEKRYNRYIANQKAEQKRKEEASVRRAGKKAQYLKRCQMNLQEREPIIKDFLASSLVDQLKIVASDEAHLPHYYPIDIKTISTEALADLDRELLAELRKRFSNLKKKEWKQFYQRLLSIM